MIIYGSIILAIILAAVLKYKFKKQLVLWELIVMLVVPTLLSFASKAIIEYTQVNFIEYWGSEVKSVYEQEPWNEWHHETCSRQVPCGRDSKGNTTYCTQYYDCSHQDDYGPEWYCETTTGERFSISEWQYDTWMKKFGGKKIITQTRDNYSASSRCVRSGGTKFDGKSVGEYSYVYRVDWDKQVSTSVPVTTMHSYENRIKASDYSVFNYSKLSDDDVKKYKLYDYPELTDNFTYPTILARGSNQFLANSAEGQLLMNKVNGHLGPTKQVRIWVLLFQTDDSETGWMQENYWVGGNKNELVINIGCDSMSNIKWCHVFSWSNSQGLKDNIVNYVKSQKKLNCLTWKSISDFLLVNIDKNWERLDFKQFDYLSVDPPMWTIVLTYVITLLVCGGFGFFFIRNDITTDDTGF